MSKLRRVERLHNNVEFSKIKETNTRLWQNICSNALSRTTRTWHLHLRPHAFRVSLQYQAPTISDPTLFVWDPTMSVVTFFRVRLQYQAPTISDPTFFVFRLQRDSNVWPLRYRCSVLPSELSCVHDCDEHLCLYLALRRSNIWSFIYSLASKIGRSPFCRRPPATLPLSRQLSQSNCSIRFNIFLSQFCYCIVFKHKACPPYFLLTRNL